MKYDHLEGLDWDQERQNCYTLVRAFYLDNFNIELTDYAVPNEFWGGEMDLYHRLSHDEGFRLLDVHPREYRPGDVVIMAIQASTGNHAAVLLDNNRILHHLLGQRSCVTSYGGMFRNTTVGIYRHKDVPDTLPEEPLDIRTVLPPHVRRRLEEFENAQRAAASET